MILRSVLEEKTSRIVEIIISSVKAYATDDGKDCWDIFGSFYSDIHLDQL